MINVLKIETIGPFTRTVSVPVSITASVKFTLMDRMSSKPNGSVKRSITIDSMINSDEDFDGHGHGDGTCKQAL